MFDLWKSEDQYKISVAGVVKNGYDEYNNNYCVSNRFKARPLKIYRKQYSKGISSRYNKHVSNILDVPGSYVVRNIETEVECNGIELQLDYMLSKNETSKMNCVPMKCYMSSEMGEKVYGSNKELLYKRHKTFLQNMGKIKTNREFNYEFKADERICGENSENERVVDVVRYNKLKNDKYLSNSGVSGGERILRRKYETIRKDAKLNNLSTNSIGISMAYNMPLKSKMYEKFEKKCVRNKMVNMGNKMVSMRCWGNQGSLN